MTDPDDLVVHAWERQPAESSRQYHSFTHFLYLPPEKRGMRAAYTAHRVECKGQHPLKNLHAPPDWVALRFRFGWVERAHAHDADVAARDRLRKIADIEAMQIRHISLSTAVQNLCVQRLQHLIATHAIPEMSPLQLMRVIALATDVERRARNLPTVITKVENEATGPLLDLSRLSPADLLVFESLVQRCQPVDPDGGRDGHDD